MMESVHEIFLWISSYLTNEASDVTRGKRNDEEGDVSEEVLSSLSLLVLLILTGLSFGVAYILERTHFHYIHETFTSILLGAAFSLLASFFRAESIERLVSFDAETFFFLLLPPIIFNAGYDLNRRNFFRNFGSILLFAFIGTTVSTFAVGFLCYGVVLLGLESLPLTLIDCLIFGALISATDPVTVLAIFQALKVDPMLYTLIFGESVMNDAVAIVLFEVMLGFRTSEITVVSSLMGVGSFFAIFVGSFVIGTLVGLFSALIFKHTKLHEYPMLESGIFVVLAYISYMAAQGVAASGIVSMLFCAIAMSHYSFNNLSQKSQHTTKYMFNLLSFMAENFIFIYLGVTIFAPNNYIYRPIFISFVVIIMIFARAIHVFPLSGLINCMTRDQSQKIQLKHQAMMLWSGLRGAIAFMLSLKIDWEAGPVLVTTTLMIVVITVIFFGSPTATMLRVLKIRIGVTDDDQQDSLADPIETRGRSFSRFLTEQDRAHWFISIDRKYLKPFFTTSKPYVQLANESAQVEAVDEDFELDDIPATQQFRPSS